MNPLVSVYITNYNYGKFIKTAIESVLNQSNKDFELIIIDDGSVDNSKEVIEEYASLSGISIIYQQNKGLNVTNNIAMRSATGKYIMRLDADDYLHPQALEIMSEKLESDPELGLVFPNYFYVDQDGNLIGEEKRHDFQHDVKLLDQPAHGACTMIRLHFLKDVGGYNEAYNCQDGYELWVKFIRQYKITNVSKPLFYYRQHGENLTSNELKILGTRAEINADFIKKHAYNTNTLAIVPIRGGSQDLAFKSLAGKNLLALKIQKAFQTRNIQKVIVTSPDLKVKELINDLQLNGKVSFHHRKQSEARFNQSLNPTIAEIVARESKDSDFEIIALLTLEYPLLEAYKIDDVVHTMLLFGSDSIIGVQSDNSVFYQHLGDGLKPILNGSKYTKLEREALFKQAGGISVVSKKAFLKSKKVITGRVGHVMMDQLSSIGLFSKLDWEIANYLIQNQNEKYERPQQTKI